MWGIKGQRSRERERKREKTQIARAKGKKEKTTNKRHRLDARHFARQRARRLAGCRACTCRCVAGRPCCVVSHRAAIRTCRSSRLSRELRLLANDSRRAANGAEQVALIRSARKLCSTQRSVVQPRSWIFYERVVVVVVVVVVPSSSY